MTKKFFPLVKFIAILSAGVSSTALSDTSWNVPTGDWTVDGNWTANAPTSAVPATIDNGGIATLSGTTGASDILKIGDIQGGNGLLITNSGSLSSVSGQTGATSTSSSNSVQVTGAGSTWNNTGLLFIGGDGSGNNLTIPGQLHARPDRLGAIYLRGA